MPARYRRHGPRRDSGPSLFGSIGWLFADLMLALALAFLLATMVSTIPPAVAPKPHVTATPTKTNQPGPALDLHYVPVTLSIDPSAVSANAVERLLLSNPALKGRRAGLVILFGGGSLDGPWQQLDKKIWGILQSMNDVTPLFSGAVPLQYWNGSYPSNLFLLHIYLFRTSLRVLLPAAFPGPGKSAPKPRTPAVLPARHRTARVLAARHPAASGYRPRCRGRCRRRRFRRHPGGRPDAGGHA